MADFGYLAGFGASLGTSPIGAILDLDFANARYSKTGVADTLANLVTTTHPTAGYADDMSGNWTLFGTNVARRTNKGLLVEEARTNDVPNNSGAGATVGVIGSGGVAPTGVSVPALTGITRSITLIGTTATGIDVVGYRFQGTPSATTAQVLALQPPITKVAGITRTISSFVTLNAGTLTNVTGFQFRSGAEGGVTSFTPDSTMPRILNTRVLTGTEGQAVIRWNYSDTVTPVDFTLYIGWTQGEDAAFATSPIRTTTVVVSRSADGNMSTISGMSQPLTLVALVDIPTFQLVAPGIIARLGSNGGTGFRILRAASGGNIQLGETAAPIDLGVASSGLAVISAAGDASGMAASINGAAVVTSATGLTILPSVLSIGANGDGSNSSNSFVRRVLVFPTKRSNADLVTLSSPSTWGY